MKNLFALAFVACSLVLVSCGSKETAAAGDSTVVAVDTVAKVDTTPVVVDTTAKADTAKKEEVKK